MKAASHVGAGLPAIARDFIAYVFVNSDLQSRAGPLPHAKSQIYSD